MTTTLFKNIIMGNVFKTDTSTALPTNLYIGLSSTTPTAAGGNVSEPSSTGTGYARVRLTSLSAPTNGVITNSADISWPESLSAWFNASNPATHYVIFNAATGGNLLMYNALASPRVIDADTVATIKSGNLILQLTD